jgi:uncharacterized protein (DUF924 family)
MTQTLVHPSDSVLSFWFGGPSDPWFGSDRVEWFRPSKAFDDEVRERFGALHAKIAGGECADWLNEPANALAYVIVLDQFSRNLYRGDPRAFACDERAREATKASIDRGFDLHLSSVRRPFLYMPLMHSEALEDQELSVQLFDRLARERPESQYLPYAARHREIIARFGRFPHRNAVIGRATTPEEEAFLQEPNSSF